MNIDQGKTQWTAEEQDTLRSFVREFMSAHGVSQAQVAREAEVGESTLSQFMSGNYRGNPHEIAKKVSRWLSAKHEETRLLSQAPPEPTFTETKTAAAVLGVLRSAQALSDFGLVVGPAGIGKTAAARQYKATTPRVAIATASPAVAGVSAILQQLIRSQNEMPKGRSAASKFELTSHSRRLFTEGWLVVIDEAQHVLTETLEELRAIHDETRCGLVLMGNGTVLTRIQGNDRNAAFAQLYSRAGVRVSLKGSQPEEIEAVMQTMGVSDAGVVAVAQEIGAKENLRQVVKAVRRAAMIAIGERANLTQTHVRLAYRQLGGSLAR